MSVWVNGAAYRCALVLVYLGMYIYTNTSSLPHTAHTISSQIKRENELTCKNSIQVHVCTNVSMVYLMYRCVCMHVVCV